MEADRIEDEGHHARYHHSVAEAGSIVIHVSNNMNEGTKDGEHGEDGEEEGEYRRKEMRKMQVTTARDAHCQRCTNCSRQYCTEEKNPRLDQEPAEDQAGFRSSYQTTDHLATYRMIEQKCHEWSIKLWIATIDFTKAFDSITHKSIWKAVKSCGINHEYISFLKKIYKDKNASVQTDVESNMFEFKKGTKQVDPLSGLLFNTVLQNSLKDVTKRWQKKKGMGIYLSDYDHDCLTNLRFADDVLLFATSKDQLQKMLYDFKESTEKVEVRIHPEKTKILSNQSTLGSDTKNEMQSDEKN